VLFEEFFGYPGFDVLYDLVAAFITRKIGSEGAQIMVQLMVSFFFNGKEETAYVNL